LVRGADDSHGVCEESGRGAEAQDRGEGYASVGCDLGSAMRGGPSGQTSRVFASESVRVVIAPRRSVRPLPMDARRIIVRTSYSPEIPLTLSRTLDSNAIHNPMGMISSIVPPDTRRLGTRRQLATRSSHDRCSPHTRWPPLTDTSWSSRSRRTQRTPIPFSMTFHYDSQHAHVHSHPQLDSAPSPFRISFHIHTLALYVVQ